MTNEQLLEFSAKQKKLADIISESSNLVRVLDMENCASTLQQISNKMTSDNFKIMVMGNFKNGKSTFINALLGQEVLPAFAVPTTAIINELKYGEAPKAVLHFLNPLPAQMYDGIPEKALEHMQAHNMENIPPIEMPVDEIEDYVVIPMGMDHKAASKQSPFEKVELFKELFPSWISLLFVKKHRVSLTYISWPLFKTLNTISYRKNCRWWDPLGQPSNDSLVSGCHNSTELNPCFHGKIQI